MATAADFGRSLGSIMDKVDRVVRDTAVETATELRQRIAERTPIQTGKHAADWNLSVNEPDTSIKDPDYNDPANAPNAGNVETDSFKIGDELYVSNSGPAIIELDAGSSQQAPAGFVESTVNELDDILKVAVAKAKQKNGL